MRMTIVEKIFARASGQPTVRPGDVAVVDVDIAVMMDTSFHANSRREILKVHDPDKVAVIYDHMVPAPDKAAAEAQAYAWSSPMEGSTKRRFFAVLHAPPFDTPQAAVRAAILAERRASRG